MTSSGAVLPGSQHSDSSFEDFPDVDSARQSSLPSPSFLGFTTPDHQGVANFAGSHGIPYSLGPWGLVADAGSVISPAVSVVQLYTGQLGVDCLDSHSDGCWSPLSLLAGISGTSLQISCICLSIPRSYCHCDRCFSVFLGSHGALRYPPVSSDQASPL